MALQQLPSPHPSLQPPSPASPYIHSHKYDYLNQAMFYLVWQGVAYELDDSLHFQAYYNKSQTYVLHFVKTNGHPDSYDPLESYYDPHIVLKLLFGLDLNPSLLTPT